MKCGVCGPDSLLPLVQAESDWLDIVWGTDDVQSAIAHLTPGNELDALIVSGTMQFLVPALIDNARRQGIPIYALADSSRASEWIDELPGVTRVAALAHVRPQIKPIALPNIDSPNDIGPATTDRSRVIAVWGPIGSPGATTVAIAVARLAAADGHRVILCDADTRGASITIALGLVDEVPGFAAACRLAGRGELTDSEIERLALPVRDGKVEFHVLSGLPRASRWVEIAPPKSRAVTALLREHWDVVVCDVGFGLEENEWVDGAPQRDGAARALLDLADIVVAVGVPDPVGLARFIRGLDELADIAPHPTIVMNKTTRQSAHEANDVIARFTDHRVAVSVPRDNRDGLEDALARAKGSMAEVWRYIDSAGMP